MIKRINQGLQFEVDVTKGKNFRCGSRLIPDKLTRSCIELKDLINKMLAIDPKKRITLSEIRMHPWILKLHRSPPDSYVPAFKPITQIDESIMRDVVALGFDDNQKNRHDILKNKKYHQVVTAYQLCLSRREKLMLPQLKEAIEANNSPKSSPSSKLRIASSSNKIIDSDEKREKQPSSVKLPKKEPVPIKEGPATVIPSIVTQHLPLKRSFSNEEVSSDPRRHLRLRDSDKKNRQV